MISRRLALVLFLSLFVLPQFLSGQGFPGRTQANRFPVDDPVIQAISNIAVIAALISGDRLLPG